MQRAGYPFRANDLGLEEWQDLADLDATLPDRTEQLIKTLMQLTMR